MDRAAKLEAIRALLGAAPDQALASLGIALSGVGGDLAPVAEIVEREQTVRRLSAVVFGPLLPMFGSRPDGLQTPTFSRATLKQLWRELMDDRLDTLAAVATAIEDWDPSHPPPPILDEVCLEAAALCDARPELAELAIYLRLSPFARTALARLGDWLGRANEERAAVLRLIFRDAAEVCDDAAPRLMEILLAHLPDAQLILRPISLITDRSGDRYLASSELASFGERLLERVERHVESLKGFNTAGGEAAAYAAARDVSVAGAILDEIEHSVDLARDGPWGKRVAAGRKAMAAMIEARLRECQKAVEQALPMQAVRLTGRMTRPSPKVSQPPDPRFVEPARALMVLLGETRGAAATGGFGALRTQVSEGLSDWLEVYADELVHVLNAGEAPDPDIAREYLEIAADFLAKAENDKAAQIVRRRAAVAGTGFTPPDPSQEVA
ncbi:MAG: hypothetical protein K1X35_11595 [Caulobacteraceae bacterium]|nr:hypothetical protein [Caulobacteraceae bacterium]